MKKAAPEVLTGLVELYDYKPSGKVVSIGYRLRPESWGKGIATQCVHAMIGYIRSNTQIELITAHVIPENKASGNIMRKLGCIAVTRSNPRDDFKKVMQEGTKRLREGASVIIFPQSSRSEVFNESHFNTIGIKLAKHASVPVIPMAIRTDFLANGRLLKDMGPIRRDRPVWFEFGEPFSVTGSGKEEQARVVDFIESRLKTWGCRIEKGTPDHE